MSFPKEELFDLQAKLDLLLKLQNLGVTLTWRQRKTLLAGRDFLVGELEKELKEVEEKMLG